MVEQVGITDEVGNETVGQGRGMRLPSLLTDVNRSPAARPLDCGLGALLWCQSIRAETRGEQDYAATFVIYYG
ncbi:hypothetical protein AGR2A_Lc180149 [Agrobacterium genomosp. 2 str. CFBP 5494]|uniref:Uncharacterized protein n=1 Tax=Agrobacterium genomosp. 2 str. CFBP 5494 TaxID=1183436 RepID=A0A9W5F204_9HYPH|nr:hypothetical protein AGR2A_Lc180149 [Agrobacterium genomosp. 2 str. CFBP 5494]